MSGGTPFFSKAGLNVDSYDARVAERGTGISDDLAFYVDLAQTTGGPVLELGAGTGRVSHALAAAGLEVFGLEVSEAMIARAERNAEALPEDVRGRVHFVQGSMVGYDLHRTFPLVLAPYRVFQVLATPEEQRKALLAVRRHLNPGGRLVVHNFDPRLDLCQRGSRSPVEAHTVRTAAGTTVRTEVIGREVDPLQQLVHERWRFTELDGDRVVTEEDELLVVRWIYRQEMRYLLELTGFIVENEYSDFHRAPPAYGAEQIWIARRSVPSPGRG